MVVRVYDTGIQVTAVPASQVSGGFLLGPEACRAMWESIPANHGRITFKTQMGVSLNPQSGEDPDCIRLSYDLRGVAW